MKRITKELSDQVNDLLVIVENALYVDDSWFELRKYYNRW